MAVLEPVKVIILNYPEGQEELLEAENNPENPAAGTRQLRFSREIYIEQEDFREDPPKNYFRLSPGKEVRLKHAYIIKCERVIKDENGNVTEIHCTYDPDTKSGGMASTRKVKGTLHWVCASQAVKAEIRLYDYLIKNDQPEEDLGNDDFLAKVNPNSITVLKNSLVEASLCQARPGERYQFLRQGYFCADLKDHSPDHLVFNRIVGLRDSWNKGQ
jgi:glutaminyl-tRNA synthetase